MNTTKKKSYSIAASPSTSMKASASTSMNKTRTPNSNYGKGRSSWNKGKKLSKNHKENIRAGMTDIKIWNKGKKHSPETIQKMKDGMKGKNKGKFLNEKNPRWKGNHASKNAIHKWVEQRKGKAKNHLCQGCGKVRANDWSNCDHAYKRVLDDYTALCKKCHAEHDKAMRANKSIGNTITKTFRGSIKVKSSESTNPIVIGIIDIDVKNAAKDMSRTTRSSTYSSTRPSTKPYNPAIKKGRGVTKSTSNLKSNRVTRAGYGVK